MVKSPRRIGALLAAPLAALLTSGCIGQVTAQAEPHDPNTTVAVAPAELAMALDEIYRATAAFIDYDQAEAAGFTRITPCDTDPQQGAQGYHYAIPARIDATVSLLEPEILMYEPMPNGSMRLVGVEYIVPFSSHPQPAEPPSLLGQAFMPNTRYEVWALHVWLYQFNPAGVFSTWNPLVSCGHAQN